MSRSTPVRQGIIFVVIVALGLVLAWMLGGGGGPRRQSGTTLPVVEVPTGTATPGSRRVPAVSVVSAEGLDYSPVRRITLDDGTTIPFRAVILRGESESPLPSPGPGIERLAIEKPIIYLRREPRTRREAEEAGDEAVSRFSAPRGRLQRGPGDEARLEMEGGVEARTVREGTDWTYTADEAVVDLATRTLRSRGAVSLESADLEVKGRDLEALDTDRSLTLAGGAEGTLRRSGGTSLDGGASSEEVRFRCSSPFQVVSLPTDGHADGATRHRIILVGDARVEQGEAHLEADRIVLDVARQPDGEAGSTTLEALDADGRVRFRGGRGGRDLEATADHLEARPVPAGGGSPGTLVDLTGRPRLRLMALTGEREGSVVDASSDTSATIFLPDGPGRLRAAFRGEASRAVYDRPSGSGPPVRHELGARTIVLEADRPEDDGEDLALGRVDATGEATLAEGSRRASARRMTWSPRDDGGSVLDLEGDIGVQWPAAGALDPLAQVTDAARADKGMLLVSSPGRGRLVLPPADDEEDGATLELVGGALVRRMADEREVYSLSSRDLSVTLRPLTRAVDTLEAKGEVRLVGRGEGEGGRRYAMEGNTLRVLGEGDSDEPSHLVVLGDESRWAALDLVGEDGRPLHLAGTSLDVDRRAGSFRAQGPVVAHGLLPEAPASGAVPVPGGRAELTCAALDGTFLEGTEKGSTRVESVHAHGSVAVSTSSERATGDTLDYDAAGGLVTLRGAPARVAAASPLGAGLHDGCQAPQLLLAFDDAGLREARAPGGGAFVRHRLRRGEEDGAEGVVERVAATCAGPLVYGRTSSALSGGVRLDRSLLVNGAFVEKERLLGADTLQLDHAPGADGRPALSSARAVSHTRELQVVGEGGAWKASGIGKVDLDASADRLAMETPGGRFRVDREGGTDWFRRVVYDYRRRIFTEQVGASIGR